MQPQSDQNLTELVEFLNKTHLTTSNLALRRHSLFEQPKRITIIGGTGFVGKALAKQLSKLGYRLSIVARNTRRAYEIMQFGEIGQIECVSANILRRHTITSLIQGSSAVIFAANGSSASGPNSYSRVNIIGAGQVAEIANKLGIDFIYFSALQNTKSQTNPVATSKALGEEAVRSVHKNPIILRPSLVFGAGDQLFTSIANIARFLPSMPAFADNSVKIQPVYVGDIAAFTAWLFQSDLIKNINQATHFELGGPTVLTPNEIIATILNVIKRPKTIINLNCKGKASINKLMILAQRILLGSQGLSSANIQALSSNSTVSEQATAHSRTCQAALLEPHSLAVTAPSYLWRFRPYGQFAANTTPDWSR